MLAYAVLGLVQACTCCPLFVLELARHTWCYSCLALAEALTELSQHVTALLVYFIRHDAQPYNECVIGIRCCIMSSCLWWAI
jgi:hypothetical protein